MGAVLSLELHVLLAFGDDVDAADFKVADDQAAGVDDPVDDGTDDDKEADGDMSFIMINGNVTNSVIRSSA